MEQVKRRRKNNKVNMIIESLIDYCFRESFLYQLTATLSTYCLINIVWFYRRRWKRFQLLRVHYDIPGPKPRLYDGNLSLFTGRTPHLVGQRILQDYGPFHCVFIGDEPNLIVTDLELLKQIFIERSSSFKARMKLYIDGELSEGILFTTKYDRYKAMRKVMAPHFNRYTSRGGSQTDFIEVSVRLMLDYIEQRLERSELEPNKMTANVDMHDLMKSAALHLITSLAIKLPEVQVRERETNVIRLDSFLSKADEGVSLQMIRFPVLRRLAQFVSDHFTVNGLLKKINDELDKSIKEAKKSNSPAGDNENLQLIDLLIKLHKEGKMTRDEVVGNGQALLFAGYDTTSTTLTYAFWAIAKHTDIQDRLRADLMTNGMESKYLTQVVNETLRCYPTATAFTARIATKTLTINGLTIPQGTGIMYHQWLMHRDPKIWPEPAKFDPERFAEGKEHHPCAYAPFGFGERKCLGIQLALLEMKMIICDVLLRFKLNLKAPKELELVSYAAFLSKPKGKVMVELEKLQK